MCVAGGIFLQAAYALFSGSVKRRKSSGHDFVARDEALARRRLLRRRAAVAVLAEDLPAYAVVSEAYAHVVVDPYGGQLAEGVGEEHVGHAVVQQLARPPLPAARQRPPALKLDIIDSSRRAPRAGFRSHKELSEGVPREHDGVRAGTRLRSQAVEVQEPLQLARLAVRAVEREVRVDALRDPSGHLFGGQG